MRAFEDPSIRERATRTSTIGRSLGVLARVSDATCAGLAYANARQVAVAEQVMLKLCRAIEQRRAALAQPVVLDDAFAAEFDGQES